MLQYITLSKAEVVQKKKVLCSLLHMLCTVEAKTRCLSKIIPIASQLDQTQEQCFLVTINNKYSIFILH